MKKIYSIIIKSLVYRVYSIIITFITAYIVTKSITKTFTISLIDSAVKIILYAIFEYAYTRK